VGVATDAGIMQQLEDVAEQHGRSVDEILALAAAVHAAGYHDLGEIHGKRLVGVVEHEVDLGHTRGRTGGGAGEDDVLHRLAAQLLRALLAEDPEDRIGYVRFAGPVGADDGGDTRFERYDRAVDERLEPLEDERFEIHGAPRW